MRAGRILLGIAAIGCALLLYFVNPAGARIFPPCPFYRITGLYCPGCGSLRASHHLLHGDVWGALGLNPLLVVSIPVLCLLLIFPTWRYHPRVAWCALAILVAYGILRNIPGWPFCYLAPHAS